MAGSFIGVFVSVSLVVSAVLRTNCSSLVVVVVSLQVVVGVVVTVCLKRKINFDCC